MGSLDTTTSRPTKIRGPVETETRPIQRPVDTTLFSSRKRDSLFSRHFSGPAVRFLCLLKRGDATVDGNNPAPVDRWFIPLLIGFQPSKVVQNFLHPQ